MSPSDRSKEAEEQPEAEEPTNPTLEPEAGEFRYIGLHATTLESGQPAAPGEYVEFDEKDAKKNRSLFEDGCFLAAEGMAPDPDEEPPVPTQLPAGEGGS